MRQRAAMQSERSERSVTTSAGATARNHARTYDRNGFPNLFRMAGYPVLEVAGVAWAVELASETVPEATIAQRITLTASEH